MDKEDTLVNKLPCGVKEVSPDMRPACKRNEKDTS